MLTSNDVSHRSSICCRNCDAFQAVDFVEDSYTYTGEAGSCSNTTGVVCLPFTNVYTTEYARYNRGFTPSSLSVGTTVGDFYYPTQDGITPLDRFYAINAILDSGVQVSHTILCSVLKT